MNGGWRMACGYAISDGVPRRSLIVALVVGTVLNLINQGHALFAGGPIDRTKFLLNFVVPYCVSTYGAVSYRLGKGDPPGGVR
jgi:hypothetical protein